MASAHALFPAPTALKATVRKFMVGYDARQSTARRNLNRRRTIAQFAGSAHKQGSFLCRVIAYCAPVSFWGAFIAREPTAKHLGAADFAY